MSPRAIRRSERRQRRRLSIRERATRFLRALFSSGPSEERDPRVDPPVGGIGVREPRRPLHPSSSGAVALKVPPTQTEDVRAVGGQAEADPKSG